MNQEGGGLDAERLERAIRGHEAKGGPPVPKDDVVPDPSLPLRPEVAELARKLQRAQGAAAFDRIVADTQARVRAREGQFGNTADDNTE